MLDLCSWGRAFLRGLRVRLGACCLQLGDQFSSLGALHRHKKAARGNLSPSGVDYLSSASIPAVHSDRSDEWGKDGLFLAVLSFPRVSC